MGNHLILLHRTEAGLKFTYDPLLRERPRARFGLAGLNKWLPHPKGVRRNILAGAHTDLSAFEPAQWTNERQLNVGDQETSRRAGTAHRSTCSAWCTWPRGHACQAKASRK